MPCTTVWLKGVEIVEMNEGDDPTDSLLLALQTFEVRRRETGATAFHIVDDDTADVVYEYPALASHDDQTQQRTIH